MGIDEVHRLAARQLADMDAGQANRQFSRALGLSVGEAYELQHEVTRLRERRGEQVVGYKIGCTSAAIQQQLGIREPIFGRLFDTGMFPSGVPISASRFNHLAIEGELAVRLNRDVPDVGVSDHALLAAVEAVVPVIELHDYVLCSPSPCVQELIASNGMHAGVVLPEPDSAGLSPRVERLSIRIDDQVVDECSEPWTMGGPIAALRWLAGRLARSGLTLAKGQWLLTGSPMRLYPLSVVSHVAVEAPGLGMSYATVVA